VKRRDLLILVGEAAVLLPSIGLGQQTGRYYRLGFVVQSLRPAYSALIDELTRYGFAEGGNLVIDSHGFGIRAESLEAAAVEVVNASPDAIYCGGDAAGRAVQRATSAIPVAVIADDVLRAGLVASLAHPGGNITGVSILATELDGKRLEILTEIVPGVRRIAALVDPNVTSSDQIQHLIEAMRSRGADLLIHRVGAAEEIIPAIDAAQAEGAQALSVFASPLANANRALLIQRMAQVRLPAIYQWHEFARHGALACYGPSLDSLFRQVAGQIAKILRGTKPADIPVEQPAHVELSINLQTAKALGLIIPEAILSRADEVIE
jgi:putative tryptophan/tyrosine transport system substrate-binding protein